MRPIFARLLGHHRPTLKHGDTGNTEIIRLAKRSVENDDLRIPHDLTSSTVNSIQVNDHDSTSGGEWRAIEGHSVPNQKFIRIDRSFTVGSDAIS